MEEKKLLNEELIVKVAGGEGDTDWPDKIECPICFFEFNVPPHQRNVTCPKCGRKIYIAI